MCRMFALRTLTPAKAASLLLRDENALVCQSRCDQRGESHPHGWGLGYYVDGSPLDMRSTADAATDPAFADAAERVVSAMLLAHVRQASVGETSLANTHPFRYARWLFCHNGTVTAFAGLEGRLAAEVAPELRPLRQGSTDSELVFYWLLSRFRAAGLPETIAGERLDDFADVLGRAVLELAARNRAAGPDEAEKLNFFLTDGQTLLATRWNHCLSWLVEPERVVVASEPIGPGAWREVPDPSILTINALLDTTVRPLVL